MISARLRYTGMSLLALAALTAGLAQLLDRAWIGAVLGLALTAELLLGCRRIRLTAEHHQDEQRHQLEALRAEGLSAPAEYCGDQKPLFSEHSQRTECVLRPGHSGSHADEYATRWWWIDADAPRSPRAQQR
ncbi:hypothetical protein AB0G97_09050 [Streptomyces sp. NPDC020755]|uniref:hypothetical protein n=1 Tax=Streptomyces sp. NPDC020755 TaxID=3154790 RepID=UPI0033DFA044